MTLDQLNSLDEQELCMALYIVNHISPVQNIEIPYRGLTWFRKGELEEKIMDSFPRLKKEGHSVFSSLLLKLGVPHEIKYEQPK